MDGRKLKNAIIPRGLRSWWKYNIRLKLGRYRKLQLRRIEEVRARGYANVVLIAAALPMWRLQGIYELLKKDSRFRVYVLVHPFQRQGEEDKYTAVRALEDYFTANNVEYTVCPKDERKLGELIDGINPDILFYPQNYYGLFGNQLDWNYFKDRLLCYNNYGLSTIAAQWNYNADYNNYAWRWYQATELHLQTARKLAYNKAVNAVVAGESHADAFFAPVGNDPWKKIDGKKRRRVVFAPHFQIEANDVLNRAAFLWLGNFMLELAEHYSDEVQFAFKPHPFLKRALYGHPDWGKEKTDAYYEKWASMPNTQLETGEYIELFKTSDALIHNCGSFTGEYMFTAKPVVFASKDWREIYRTADGFGSKCLDLHYRAQTIGDVRNFIEKVVLGGDDPMLAQRRQFIRDYLTPPHGRSAAENIYNDITTHLWR